MKVMVTGANGQVGKHLSKALSQSPWSLKLLARSDLDISCKRTVLAMVTDCAPDLIINAAAYTAVDKAEIQSELAYTINAKGAGNLSAAANSINAAIIHLSSDYVFSGNNKHSYREEDSTNPINAYGHSKRAGELEVIQHNPKHIILRTSWVFSEYGHNFLQTMLRLGAENADIAVVDDQVGGPTYAGDLAQTIVKMIGHYEQNHQLDWGTYHYCGYPYVSWFEFAQEIFSAFKSVQPSPNLRPVSTQAYASTTKRPHNSRLNCDKIQQTFGIAPGDWKRAINELRRCATNEHH